MRRLEMTGNLVDYCSRQKCAEQSCGCWSMCDLTQKPFTEMTDKEIEQCYNLAFKAKIGETIMAAAKNVMDAENSMKDTIQQIEKWE